MKTETIQLRLSKDEKRTIEDRATDENFNSTSDFIREKILDYVQSQQSIDILRTEATKHMLQAEQLVEKIHSIKRNKEISEAKDKKKIKLEQINEEFNEWWKNTKQINSIPEQVKELKKGLKKYSDNSDRKKTIEFRLSMLEKGEMI